MNRLNLLTLFLISLAAVWSLILFAFESFFSVELPRSSFLTQAMVLVATGWWIGADASRRRIPLGAGSSLAFVGLFPAFLIFYCFRSRGRRGGIPFLIASGATLAYLAIYAILAVTFLSRETG